MSLDEIPKGVALQIKLLGDGWRWMTVARIHGDVDRACDLAASFASECEPMDLRLVRDDRLQQTLRMWSSDTGWVTLRH